LEQEIIELQGIIDKEIEELVEQLAREKGVEIAVLEENKGQEGVDFTPDLIEMLD